MKVTAVSSSYSHYSISRNLSAKNRQTTNGQQNATPSFNGNAGKVIGGIAGFIAITAICPVITMVGLGGIGVMAGLAAGSAIDDKIEEKQNQSKKND